MSNKKLLTKNHIENKSFNFSKGNVNLSFTLRIDVKSELQDFKELLKEAIIDIEEEVAVFNSKGSGSAVKGISRTDNKGGGGG